MPLFLETADKREKSLNSKQIIEKTVTRNNSTLSNLFQTKKTKDFSTQTMINLAENKQKACNTKLVLPNKVFYEYTSLEIDRILHRGSKFQAEKRKFDLPPILKKNWKNYLRGNNKFPLSKINQIVLDKASCKLKII
jgi:hypothetical protein